MCKNAASKRTINFSTIQPMFISIFLTIKRYVHNLQAGFNKDSENTYNTQHNYTVTLVQRQYLYDRDFFLFLEKFGLNPNLKHRN